MDDKPNDHFLNQTAIEYDIDVDTVIDIYNKSDGSGDFYNQLELFILNKKNH